MGLREGCLGGTVCAWGSPGAGCELKVPAAAPAHGQEQPSPGLSPCVCCPSPGLGLLGCGVLALHWVFGEEGHSLSHCGVGQHRAGTGSLCSSCSPGPLAAGFTARMLGCSLSRGNTRVVPQGSHRAEPFSLTLCCLPGSSGSQVPPASLP